MKVCVSKKKSIRINTKKGDSHIYHTKQVQAVELYFSYSIIKTHTYIWYKIGLNRKNQSLLADDEDRYN